MSLESYYQNTLSFVDGERISEIFTNTKFYKFSPHRSQEHYHIFQQTLEVRKQY